MNGKRRCKIGFMLALILVVASVASAERITLKNGTVLEGTVIKQGDSYWVKTPDGQSRTIPANEVESIGDGASGGAGDAGGSRTTTFATTKRRADGVDTPLAAVAIWQAFIESKPTQADLEAAQKEMAHWKELADGGAEKINGKWVGGEERKAILEKSDKLAAEGWEAMSKNQTLAAVKKLEEAAKVYPNSYRVNFLLGYLSMLQNKEDDAIKRFEQSLRQRPTAPEALCNIGVCYASKRQLDKAIQSFNRAAESQDSKEIAQNLVNAFAYAPPAMRKSAKMQPIVDNAHLLASKYGIRGPSKNWLLMGLQPDDSKEGSGAPRAGMMSSGTGFIINDEGLILTNRHVVDGGKTFMVIMHDQKQRTAEVVVMDDEQDLALIKIKAEEDEKLPFLQLSTADVPGDGAECTVLGYPMIDRLGGSIKITRGIVSSAAKQAAGADVLIDAKVNPGNSGGPILDRNGNVMAVVSMKSLATALEESYGLGISAGRVREFLEKNKIAATPAQASDDGLSAEEIATKVKPATVCIIATR